MKGIFPANVKNKKRKNHQLKNKTNKPRKSLAEMAIKCLAEDIFIKFQEFVSLTLKAQTTF